MSINKELLKGSMKTLVLKLISTRASHGYELSKRVDQLTEGRIQLNEGTLYPILHSLEADGWIEAVWEKPTGKRKRKVYHITKMGKDALKEKTESWNEFVNTIQSVLGAASCKV